MSEPSTTDIRQLAPHARLLLLSPRTALPPSLRFRCANEKSCQLNIASLPDPPAFSPLSLFHARSRNYGLKVCLSRTDHPFITVSFCIALSSNVSPAFSKHHHLLNFSNLASNPSSLSFLFSIPRNFVVVKFFVDHFARRSLAPGRQGTVVSIRQRNEGAGSELDWIERRYSWKRY